MTTLREASGGAGTRKIGYFCHLRLQEKHIGAVLVTNQIGVPLEFKYTEPIAATRLHKILYGAALDRYLHEVVIRDRLGGEVRTLPEYFITPYDDKEFLGAMAGREMMAIQRSNASPGECSGPFTKVREREAFVETEEGLTLRLAFSTSDEALQHSMVDWLQELSKTMDVVEPIERVRSALAALCGEEKRA